MITSLIMTQLIGWSLTFSGPGLTYHPLLNADEYEMMKHRVGNNAVLHPIEFGLTYKTEHFQATSVYLKDCFGNHAGMLALGPKVDLIRDILSFGGIFGGYVRETMTTSDVPLVYRKWGLDFTPMAGATISLAIPIAPRTAIDINAFSNVYINHAHIGLRLSF